MNVPDHRAVPEPLAASGPRWLGSLASAWALAGFSLLLIQALRRLAPHALDLCNQRLSWLHWASLIGWVGFMAYSEGYRGFQQNFSPRFAARLRWLRRNPTLLRAVLAPLFCMGYFGTTRKRKIVAYSLTAGIVLLVLLVRVLPQPWRGIVDAGVVLGLAWGLLTVLWLSARAVLQDRDPADPEVVGA
jgi:hypothetical protein